MRNYRRIIHPPQLSKAAKGSPSILSNNSNSRGSQETQRPKWTQSMFTWSQVDSITIFKRVVGIFPVE